MPQDCTDTISRPVFFDSQSLTRDDLNAVIDYFRAHNRRHNRTVVGYGVTCGLQVQRVTAEPWHLQVGPGHAVLPSGEEVAVPAAALPIDICAAAQSCLGIAQGCVAPLGLAAGPGSAASGADRGPVLDFTTLVPGGSLDSPMVEPWVTVSAMSATNDPLNLFRTIAVGGLTGLALAPSIAVNLAADTPVVEIRLVHSGRRPLVTALNAAGAVVDQQSPISAANVAANLRLQGTAIRRVLITQGDGVAAVLGVAVPATARGTVYLALYPDETPARFMPPMPDRCSPPGNDLLPTRVCEGYRLAVLCARPSGHAPPDCAAVGVLICTPAHVPCLPEPNPADDCVILASVECGDFGILSVDEFTHRRRVLPQALLSSAEACACTSTVPPPPPPTPVPTPPPTIIPTVFTQVTLFTRFTEATFFTNASRFTALTDFTIFTGPGTFTFATLGPDILVPIGGLVLPVGDLDGIGPVLGTRLRDEGIATATEFVGRDTVDLSRIMGVSEVRVAEMQLRARERIGRRGPG